MKRNERVPLFAERVRLHANLILKKGARSTAKTYRDSSKKEYDRAKADHDKIVNEIAAKKKKKAEKEAERIKTAERVERTPT